MDKNKMMSYEPMSLPLRERHGLLLGCIGPRPIAWASTIDLDGRPNLAPFSFFNIFSSNPPVLIFSPARSGRTNTTKHSYDNVKMVPEVVINIVSHDLLDQMVISSMEYPEGVSEFAKAGLTEIKSDVVAPPRVGEAKAQFECKVIEVKELGHEGGAGNLIICEVVKMHIRKSIMDAQGKIDPVALDALGRLGGAWYCRADASSLFEVNADMTRPGVGFERLPHDILNSPILSGNDLGKLARQAELPDETAVNDFKLESLSEDFLELQDDPDQLRLRLHTRAKAFLTDEKIVEAWMTLLSFNP